MEVDKATNTAALTESRLRNAELEVVRMKQETLQSASQASEGLRAELKQAREAIAQKDYDLAAKRQELTTLQNEIGSLRSKMKDSDEDRSEQLRRLQTLDSERVQTLHKLEAKLNAAQDETNKALKVRDQAAEAQRKAHTIELAQTRKAGEDRAAELERKVKQQQAEVKELQETLIAEQQRRNEMEALRNEVQ